MSYLRTTLLLGLLTGILLAVGYFWQGVFGMTVFLFIAFAINFVSYWYSDKIVLRMYGAKPISEDEEPRLHEIVEKLAKNAKIPKPKICLVNLPNPNAFACGRSPKHAAVAVTSGLLKHLEWDEIEGVLAHELVHIAKRDTLTATIAATIAGAISYIAHIAWWSLFLGGGRRGGNLMLLPLVLLAPIAAVLVQMAISRTREFKADHDGGILSKKPLSLASALGKIAQVAKTHPLRGNAATSHLFIVNPFKGDALSNLFSTHPDVNTRIQKLKELDKKLTG